MGLFPPLRKFPRVLINPCMDSDGHPRGKLRVGARPLVVPFSPCGESFFYIIWGPFLYVGGGGCALCNEGGGGGGGVGGEEVRGGQFLGFHFTINFADAHDIIRYIDNLFMCNWSPPRKKSLRADELMH